MNRHRPPRSLLVLAALAVLCLPATTVLAADEPEKPTPPPWQEVERLISEQKLEAAVAIVDQLLATARGESDAEAWTRALVQGTQLRLGLHGYERAWSFLHDTPWPEGEEQRMVLRLFAAETLVQYLRSYRWEIEQRERTARPVDDPAAAAELDLETATVGEIAAAANLLLRQVWEGRGTWGERSMGDLSRYVAEGTYPARIRGTLRDVVTYHWVELLADSSLWTPAESNAVRRLDLEQLATIAPETLEAGADDAAHPLAKAMALLADLEAWHAAAGRSEAALEAVLERFRRLAQHADEGDRELLAELLSRRLAESDRALPWWSMGQVELAEMVRQEMAPDALERARQLALAAAEAHPDSFGGRRAVQLVAAIEQPQVQLLGMESDGPARRSLLLEHQNLEEVHFRAYRYDVDAILAARYDAVLPQWDDVAKLISSSQPVAEWRVELPTVPDYRSHRTYVTPPLPEHGLYLVVASVRGDFAIRANHRQAIPFLRTGLVTTARTAQGAWAHGRMVPQPVVPQRTSRPQPASDLGPGEIEVMVRDGESGDPAAGVEVELWRHDWQRGHRQHARQTSDERGLVRFSVSLEAPGRESYFVVARRGDDVLVDPQALHPGGGELPAEPQRSALLYSDRSVYRPGQEVQWKAVAFTARNGDGGPLYEVLPRTAMVVRLRDANGETVAEEKLESNDFGSTSGSFTVARGRLLGGWFLETSLGGHLPIQVEEYKRPTFEVEVEDPASEMRLGEPATFRGVARYYFGAPVSAGAVSWQVIREPVFPWWWFGRRPGGGETEMVASGESSLDADGGFELGFTPAADRAADPEVSYRYRLRVEVTAEGGETRDVERVFRLGNVAVEARVVDPPGFHLASEPVVLELRRSDLDGTPRAGGAHWELLELEQPSSTRLPAEQPVVREELPWPFAELDPVGTHRTPGDELRPRWAAPLPIERSLRQWSAGRAVASGSLDHDAEGLATLRLESLPAGVYRLRYTTEDAWGASYELLQELIVAAEGMRLELPAVLLAERRSVAPGEVLRLLVHSGLGDQSMRLETQSAGDRGADSSPGGGDQLLRSDSGVRIIEVPIGIEDQGGFSYQLTLVRDFQLMVQQLSLLVPWTDRQLEVEMASFRDQLRPGQEETWTVTVRGDDGEAVAAGAAELLAYMYDRSLDLFAPHRPVDPLSLYPGPAWIPPPVASVGVATPVWADSRDFGEIPEYQPPIPPRLELIDGYAIGGPGVRFRRGMVGKEMMAESAMAMPSPPAPAMPQSVAVTSMATNDAAGFDGEEELEADATAVAPDSDADLGVRTEFAETAFFLPHLVNGADGSVGFTFTVPEAVTEWSVWVHALTRDLRSGSIERRVRTVKELLVRPYLPRFFREGDQVELSVVINNTGEETLAGSLTLELIDPATGVDLRREFGLEPALFESAFEVEANRETELVFPVTVPSRVGLVAVRAVGRTPGLSDGEVRPLPILPGRMHLSQSRFAALREGGERSLRFAELAAADDPTRIDEGLIVTVDAQLFGTVLRALPYLVDYPYECSEQNLNRFFAAGVLAAVYEGHPEVAAMAEQLAGRETPLEAWDDEDPNRQMALVETPWLVLARGGDAAEHRLIDLLDPATATRERDAALASLVRSQTASGAFPWFPGGPPSPYMTLYVLYGMAKAQELGVPVADQPAAVEAIRRGWQYLHRHYLDEVASRMVDEDCCWELVTFLGYVLSAYPDAEIWTGGAFSADDRRRMLEHSFRHWRDHSPLLKAYLALTLERAGRGEDARLVFDSLMDSAKTDPDLGTYWAPEDRAWLWYNDTTEGHALALRALTELAPEDPRRDGLAQWLMLDKKLNHWKSTRSTAEVIYALVHYLQAEGAIGAREEIRVAAGPRREVFVFEPDRYVGQNQLVIAGSEVVPAMAEIEVEKEGPGLAFASATWHFSTEQLPSLASGDLFAVERSYFRRRPQGNEWVLEPLASGDRLVAGEQMEVQLTIRAAHAAEYVHLRDPRPAGFEPEDLTSGYRWDLGLSFYQETRDSGTNFFFDWLPAGEYVLKYRLRAAHGGSFKSAPAELQSMYAPEFNAYSAGSVLRVGDAENP